MHGNDKGRKYMKKILFVEEIPKINTNIIALLQKTYIIHQASSVDQAKNKLKNNKYSLIILEYNLPGFKSIEFLQEVRIKYNKLPVLFMTSFPTIDNFTKALNLGVSMLESKPIDHYLINDRINYLINNHKMRIPYEMYDIKPRFTYDEHITNTMLSDIRTCNKRTSKVIADLNHWDHKGVARCFENTMKMTVEDYSILLNVLQAKESIDRYGKHYSKLYYIYGFKRKWFFNKCFKKYIGMTPEQYMNKVEISRSLPSQG